jgi:hypothetical protein
MTAMSRGFALENASVREPLPEVAGAGVPLAPDRPRRLDWATLLL